MSREAMKQALKALEALYLNDYSGYEISKHESDIIDDAKTALRQALETEQEPVAWADAIIDDLQGLFDTDGITEQDSGDALIRLSDAIATVEDERKRYTSPQKRDLTCVCGAVWEGETMVHPPRDREWVGLTAYEIQEIHIKNTHWGNFASAIEAKLKEKNG